MRLFYASASDRANDPLHGYNAAMRLLKLLLLSVALSACRREPPVAPWLVGPPHARDGWKIAIPEGYFSRTTNRELLMARWVEMRTLFGGDGGAAASHILRNSYFWGKDVGCSLDFDHLVKAGFCGRYSEDGIRRGGTQTTLTLPNGEWTRVERAEPGGNVYVSIFRCEGEHFWEAMHIMTPSCLAGGRAREPALLEAVGAAELLR